MKITKAYSGVKKRLLLVVVMSALIFLLFQLKNYPESVEQYYSQAIFPFIRAHLQLIFNQIPFSIGDIFYLFLTLFIVVSLIQIIKKGFFQKKGRDAVQILLKLVLTLQVSIVVFYLFWGLNYFRADAFERLDLTKSDYSSAELIEVGSMLIDSVNYSRMKVSKEDLAQSNDSIFKSSSLAIQNIGTSKPIAKPSLSGPILSYLGTAGYYNPFTGEAQVNMLMPIYLRPFVACHEMAHQNGYGAENEANFIGFLAGINSNNRLLKYSCYYLATQEFMTAIWATDSLAFKTLKSKISPSVLSDLKSENEYWKSYRGATSKLSSIFYDKYLKANNQPDGLRTYNKMIRLSMAYYKKRGLIKAPVNLAP
jgi:hypothetical protein